MIRAADQLAHMSKRRRQVVAEEAEEADDSGQAGAAAAPTAQQPLGAPHAPHPAAARARRAAAAPPARLWVRGVTGELAPYDGVYSIVPGRLHDGCPVWCLPAGGLAGRRAESFFIYRDRDEGWWALGFESDVRPAIAVPHAAAQSLPPASRCPALPPSCRPVERQVEADSGDISSLEIGAATPVGLRFHGDYGAPTVTATDPVRPAGQRRTARCRRRGADTDDGSASLRMCPGAPGGWRAGGGDEAVCLGRGRPLRDAAAGVRGRRGGAA